MVWAHRNAPVHCCWGVIQIWRPTVQVQICLLSRSNIISIKSLLTCPNLLDLYGHGHLLLYKLSTAPLPSSVFMTLSTLWFVLPTHGGAACWTLKSLLMLHYKECIFQRLLILFSKKPPLRMVFTKPTTLHSPTGLHSLHYEWSNYTGLLMELWLFYVSAEADLSSA